MKYYKSKASASYMALALTCAALTACASTPKYRFVSDQSDIKVTLSDENDSAYKQSCTAPCVLSVELSRALYAEFEKPGYQSQRADNLEEAFNPAFFNAALKKLGENPRPGSRPKVSYRITLSNLEEMYARGYPRPESEEVQAQRAAGLQEARQNSQAARCAELDLEGVDKKAKALRRTPPEVTNTIMNSGHSGHCLIRLNATPAGYPTDIEAYFCTHPMFKAPLLESVDSWVYPPKTETAGGEVTPYCGIEAKIVVRMMDPFGKLLPEHEP